MRKFHRQYIPRRKKQSDIFLYIYIHNRRRGWHNPRFSRCKSDRTRWRRIEKGAKIGVKALSRFILSIYYSLGIVKRYFYGMNTLPRVTKDHHWRPLNALRFLSTRLLTPSSIVFQPIFLLSRTQIRVNGCNYPYPTASASSSSPPRQTNARLEERKKRYSSNNKRTVKICIRPLFLSVQPTFICLSVAGKLMEREMGGEKKEGGEEKRWLPSENRPRSPVGTDSSGDTSLQRFVSKMKLNFLLFAQRKVCCCAI